LKKVVLSRIKEVDYDKDPIEIFKSLNSQHPSTFNYIFSSAVFGCWMGATPEVLLQKTEDALETVSLAGTILQSESWTKKEREEQQFVTDYIVSTLENNNLKAETHGPVDQNNGIVKHLKTEIKAKSNSETDFRSLLEQLHPTPATCGIPTKESMDFIIASEIHNRKFYTGYILLNFLKPMAFVNLRCMELGKTTAQLYLGGGLTAMSEVEKEWEETERKAQTLLKAFK
jgi:isochorismate synthase